jgi:hypothetical protein
MHIDQRITDASQTDNATGSLSAKVSPAGWVPGDQFVATSVHFSQTDSTVGVLGMLREENADGAQASDPIYMFLGFPASLEEGDHEIGAGEQGVWAYFASSTGGYATGGKVTGLQWNKDAGILQAAHFEFQGKAENGQAFSITNGKFCVDYQSALSSFDSSELTATGSGSASIDPAFMNIAHFTANRFELHYDASVSKGFVTLLEYDAQDVVQAGARLGFSVVEGVVTPDKAALLVGQGVYPADPSTFTVTEVSCNEDMTHVAFAYTFDLSRSNEPRTTVKGELDVRRG